MGVTYIEGVVRGRKKTARFRFLVDSGCSIHAGSGADLESH
jgi:hypothetical protein